MGVRGLHKGEGVRTGGREHPGQAGEQLPKQRPNVNEGLPASESHTVKMRMVPVLDALPASPDVNKQRRIAAAPPFLDRAVCDGAVRTFSEVDVPEVEGRSKRNLESRVMLADVNNSCRNSPFEEASRRWCARLEVDAFVPRIPSQQHSRACQETHSTLCHVNPLARLRKMRFAVECTKE